MHSKHFTLAHKMACLTAGLGLCMTLGFTLVSYVQMQDLTYKNFQGVLAQLTRSKESCLVQDYQRYRELADLRRQGGGEDADTQDGDGWRQKLLHENVSDLPLGVQLAVLDSDGKVLAPQSLTGRPLPVRLSAQQLADAAVSGRMAEVKESGRRFSYQVFFFAPERWYVISVLSHRMLDDMLQRRIRNIAATGLVITLVGFGVSFVLGRRLSRG